jgi:hypothetical protein
VGRVKRLALGGISRSNIDRRSLSSRLSLTNDQPDREDQGDAGQEDDRQSGI